MNKTLFLVAVESAVEIVVCILAGTDDNGNFVYLERPIPKQEALDIAEKAFKSLTVVNAATDGRSLFIGA